MKREGCEAQWGRWRWQGRGSGRGPARASRPCSPSSRPCTSLMPPSTAQPLCMAWSVALSTSSGCMLSTSWALHLPVSLVGTLRLNFSDAGRPSQVALLPPSTTQFALQGFFLITLIKYSAGLTSTQAVGGCNAALVFQRSDLAGRLRTCKYLCPWPGCAGCPSDLSAARVRSNAAHSLAVRVLQVM